jgi:hypothetical protein
MRLKRYLQEKIEVDIEIGDVVLGGKFKNKRIVVKEIGTNEKGDITINKKPLLKFRILPKVEEGKVVNLLAKKIKMLKKKHGYVAKSMFTKKEWEQISKSKISDNNS